MMYRMYMLTYMSPAVDTVDVAVIIPAACELPVEISHIRMLYLYVYTSSLLIHMLESC